jgi:uncharacterized membrane protein
MVNVVERLWRQVRIRPRLLAGLACGMLVSVCLPTQWGAREITRLILGWNAGAWLYLGLAGWMMWHAGHDQIRRHARQDEGARVILALVAVSALFSLGAIVAELAVAKEQVGSAKLAHIALAVLTIMSSWAFTQMSFALHYAHVFYLARSRGQAEGLLFPGSPDPDYMDFLYFAAVIGTSGQTADVSFTSTGMRRLGLLHCVLAFMINTSLIGLMINVGSSLL